MVFMQQEALSVDLYKSCRIRYFDLCIQFIQDRFSSLIQFVNLFAHI